MAAPGPTEEVQAWKSDGDASGGQIPSRYVHIPVRYADMNAKKFNCTVLFQRLPQSDDVRGKMAKSLYKFDFASCVYVDVLIIRKRTPKPAPWSSPDCFILPTCFYQPFGCRCCLCIASAQNTELIIGSKFPRSHNYMEFIFHFMGDQKRLKNFAIWAYFHESSEIYLPCAFKVTH